MNKLTKYNKFLIAVLTVVLAGASAVYGNNIYVTLAIQVAGAFGVYVVPNKTIDK